MKVLTIASTITCAHQGTVQLTASQHKFQVDGRPVLVEGDLIGAAITGCTTVPSPPPNVAKQCFTVVAMTTGSADKFKIEGKAVLLETAAGLTDGLVTGGTPGCASPVGNCWSVQSANQTALDAD